ncbi:hypothetical protein NXW23_11585 [Bacteroides caccae]|jgi:hypothetical protein|uniref:Uncharacterized protein n=1 Tax=Bacteroides caccae TaxID=47678 RepID=A0AA94Y6W7_9BACE|nr:hypothetical protein NXW23_11585 [Bacteroides caccae]
MSKFKDATNVLLERVRECMSNATENESYFYGKSKEADELALDIELLLYSFDPQIPLLPMVSAMRDWCKGYGNIYHKRHFEELESILKKFITVIELRSES